MGAVSGNLGAVYRHHLSFTGALAKTQRISAFPLRRKPHPQWNYSHLQHDDMDSPSPAIIYLFNNSICKTYMSPSLYQLSRRKYPLREEYFSINRKKPLPGSTGKAVEIYFADYFFRLTSAERKCYSRHNLITGNEKKSKQNECQRELPQGERKYRKFAEHGLWAGYAESLSSPGAPVTELRYQDFPRTYRGLHGDAQMNLGGNTIFRPLLDGRFFITIF